MYLIRQITQSILPVWDGNIPRSVDPVVIKSSDRHASAGHKASASPRTVHEEAFARLRGVVFAV
jgi:hypothetical protein